MPALDLTIRETRAQRLCEEAWAHLHANRPVQALEMVKQALRMSPESPTALSLFGLCLAKVDANYGDAIRACRQALVLAPENVELRTNLGRVYRLQGDNGSAHRTFLEAWRRDRTHPAAAAELARMGVRHPPVLSFLPRSHWCNRKLGLLRQRWRRALGGRRTGY